MQQYFSDVHAFRSGQFVSIDGVTGIAVGWKPGRLGKMVAVRITATKSRWKKGAIVFARPAQVAARKGNAGSGRLARMQVGAAMLTVTYTMTAVGRSYAA